VLPATVDKAVPDLLNRPLPVRDWKSLLAQKAPKARAKDWDMCCREIARPVGDMQLARSAQQACGQHGVCQKVWKADKRFAQGQRQLNLIAGSIPRQTELRAFSARFPLVAVHGEDVDFRLGHAAMHYVLVAHASKKPLFQILMQLEVVPDSLGTKLRPRCATHIASELKTTQHFPSDHVGALQMCHSASFLKDTLGAAPQKLLASTFTYDLACQSLLGAPALQFCNLQLATSKEFCQSTSSGATSSTICPPALACLLGARGWQEPQAGLGESTQQNAGDGDYCGDVGEELQEDVALVDDEGTAELVEQRLERETQEAAMPPPEAVSQTLANVARQAPWRTDVPWLQHTLPNKDKLANGIVYCKLLRQPRKKCYIGYYEHSPEVQENIPKGFKKKQSMNIGDSSEHLAAAGALRYV
jgi:hypothetical protein